MEIISPANVVGRDLLVLPKAAPGKTASFSRLHRIKREMHTLNTYQVTHTQRSTEAYKPKSRVVLARIFILFFDITCVILIPIITYITCLLYKIIF